MRAQLVLENPKHLDVSEQQAQVLFLATNRVLEAEFHAPGTLENTFRMRHVLGEKAERFTINDPSGNGTIDLEKWNEGRFAVAAMRLALFSIYWFPSARSARRRRSSGARAKLHPLRRTTAP
jgi:hypothetical protein